MAKRTPFRSIALGRAGSRRGLYQTVHGRPHGGRVRSLLRHRRLAQHVALLLSPGRPRVAASPPASRDSPRREFHGRRRRGAIAGFHDPRRPAAACGRSHVVHRESRLEIAQAAFLPLCSAHVAASTRGCQRRISRQEPGGRVWRFRRGNRRVFGSGSRRARPHRPGRQHAGRVHVRQWRPLPLLGSPGGRRRQTLQDQRPRRTSASSGTRETLISAAPRPTSGKAATACRSLSAGRAGLRSARTAEN